MSGITGAILAGGKSSRMGSDKAFVKLDNHPIIKYIIQEIKPETGELLLVTNNQPAYRHLGLPLVSDIYANRGPLSGIHSALVHARFDRVLVLACDMPFLSRKLVRYLIGQSQDYDVTVPLLKGYPQPLLAVYARTCLESVEVSLQKPNPRIIDFYSRVRVKYVKENEFSMFVDPRRVFFNVNTPDDLALARNMAAKGETDV